MSIRFIQTSFSGIERRPLLAALIVYWVAIGAAILILTFAIRQDASSSGRGAHACCLASLSAKESSAATVATV